MTGARGPAAPATGGAPAPGERYRAAELRVFPAGGGVVLVYSRDSGAARLLPADVATSHLFAVGSGAWVASLAGRFDPGLAATPAERLARLGRHLEEVGRLPAAELDELVRVHAWEALASLAAALEGRPGGGGVTPYRPGGRRRPRSHAWRASARWTRRRAVRAGRQSLVEGHRQYNPGWHL